MNGIWPELGIRPADILLPADCDMNRWSVVACDQYTSQPEYWERVREYVGSAPSTLNLTFPEVWLDSPDAAERIADIHRNMRLYQDEGIFRRIEDALIYVERQLSDGLVRRGLLGAVDLEQYDYSSDWKGLIRATEGVVPKRLPPRVAVRQGADLELPHVLMLIDDPLKTVIEPLADEKDQMKKLYDFDLMERGGHIRGWLLTEELKGEPINVKEWQREYDDLRAEYAGLRAQYNPLKEELEKLRSVQYQVSRVINERSQNQQVQKKREAEQLI